MEVTTWYNYVTPEKDVLTARLRIINISPNKSLLVGVQLNKDTCIFKLGVNNYCNIIVNAEIQRTHAKVLHTYQ